MTKEWFFDISPCELKVLTPTSTLKNKISLTEIFLIAVAQINHAIIKCIITNKRCCISFCFPENCGNKIFPHPLFNSKCCIYGKLDFEIGKESSQNSED